MELFSKEEQQAIIIDLETAARLGLQWFDYWSEKDERRYLRLRPAVKRAFESGRLRHQLWL